MSAAVAEPTAHDPDARGHFGVFGGRYVPEALMARVNACHDPQTVVELVATVAAYNMVSRFLVALNISH